MANSGILMQGHDKVKTQSRRAWVSGVSHLDGCIAVPFNSQQLRAWEQCGGQGQQLLPLRAMVDILKV